MKKAYIPFAAVVVALTLTAPALADAPNLLNYQGRLTDPSGNPKNGAFTMQFAVYDAETGGNQLPTGTPWSETQSVTVTNGVFNVLVGSVTALPLNLFEGGPSDASGPLRFLQVMVSGEALAPRRRIVSAAYAVHSETATSALGVYDYGTSPSSYSSGNAAGLKIAYGELSSISGSQAITNLPFTSASTYQAVAYYKYTQEVSAETAITKNSGSQFTIYGNHASGCMWIAIGR